MTSEVRRRPATWEAAEAPTTGMMPPSKPDTANDVHSLGEAKHGRLMQVLRGLSLATFFITCCITWVASPVLLLLFFWLTVLFSRIHITQFLGAFLYWVNRDLYYGYMALTKQSFGLFITTITHWWGPTTIRISGDASVSGQIRKTADGRVEFAFPERMVMIANHQVRTSLGLIPPSCC